MATLQAHEFVSLVVGNFKGRKGVFSEHRNVEDYVPDGVSELLQSLFLFYVIQLDYAVRGRVLYEGAKKLWAEDRDFFTPQKVLSLSDEKLFEILSGYLHPRYPNEAVIRYRENSQKLLNEYGGNPLSIFVDSKSGIEATVKIRDFRGMGPKTGHLFFRAMVLYFGIEYDDIEAVLPPVDRHDVRIAYLMGYVNSDDMTDSNINKVKKVWNQACKDAKENWLIFDQALWLLGSEGKPKTKEDLITLLSVK